MDLPPMDYYFFDRSVIVVEVVHEEKHREHAHAPEGLDWLLRSVTRITPSTRSLTFTGAAPEVNPV